MPYQAAPFAPSQGRPPQGHPQARGTVHNHYSNHYTPFPSHQHPSDQYVPPNFRPHERYQVPLQNSPSYSNHQVSWPTPIGPPPNHYSSSDVYSHQPIRNMAFGEVFVDEDFLRETDDLIHGFQPSMAPAPFTNVNQPHQAHIHNSVSGDLLVPEDLLRETDELIHGFKPPTPMPNTSNPHWQHNRGNGIVDMNAVPGIQLVDASLIQEVDELLQNFELEPTQARRPSWGPHRTRQSVRGETPMMAVEKNILDEADALIQNFNPNSILPQTPVGRKSSLVVNGRRRHSSTLSSLGAGDAGPNDDPQQSPVSQKRKARFAYLKESWEPKRSQNRKPNNADSPRRISKGLLEKHGRDWSRLKPGRVHTLVGNPAFVPQSLNRVSAKDLPVREEAVKYQPRSQEFSGKTHANHLILSVCGMPGPYIMDLAEENLVIDGHDDDVFLELGLRETKFKIDWPGLSLRAEGFKIFEIGRTASTTG